MEDSPIANLIKTYKKIVPNPAMDSVLKGTAAFLLARAGIPLVRNLMIQGVRKISPTQARNMQMQQPNTTFTDWVIPGALGLSIAALPIISNFDSRKQGNNLFSWNAPFRKTQSLNCKSYKQTSAINNLHKQMRKTAQLWQTVPYDPTVNLATHYDPAMALSIMQSAPYVSSNPYTRCLGTSIINAANTNSGHNPTLGNLYDSAYNKFQKKLSIGGILGTAVKSTVSAGLAGMFTDVIGNVLGFPSDVTRKLSRTSAVGTALYNILT